MATNALPGAEPRNRLSRARVLQAAIAQADAGGLDDLSMRKLAEVLEVAPMALYRHVASRDDLIDGMIDLVFAEIDVPATGPDWRTAMHRRAVSVRDAMARHRWAIGLMESRRNPVRRACATTTRSSAASARPASTSRWQLTRTRCWTATSTGSR